MSESASGEADSPTDSSGKVVSGPKHKNKEWLHEQYWGEMKSTREMSSDADVCKATIVNWMGKLGVPIRDRTHQRKCKPKTGAHPKLSDKEWLESRYHDDGLTGDEIADLCNVTQRAVFYWMERYDISRRSQREALGVGEDCTNWKGGSIDYYGPNWIKQRKKTLKRDQYRCQRCRKHQPELEMCPDVHHRKKMRWYKNNYDKSEWYEKSNDLDNLITLCRSCHREWEGIPLTLDVRL